jgi:hypothetical protein
MDVSVAGSTQTSSTATLYTRFSLGHRRTKRQDLLTFFGTRLVVLVMCAQIITPVVEEEDIQRGC